MFITLNDCYKLLDEMRVAIINNDEYVDDEYEKYYDDLWEIVDLINDGSWDINIAQRHLYIIFKELGKI